MYGNYDKPYISVQMALIKSIFREYEFDFQVTETVVPQPFYKYKDTQIPMLAFRLSNFRKIEKPIWPELPIPIPFTSGKKYAKVSELDYNNITQEYDNMAASTATARSNAALKAAATKRANEAARARKLSQAALKAHATRRANGWVHPLTAAKMLAEKRAAAARKAAATKRRNAAKAARSRSGR